MEKARALAPRLRAGAARADTERGLPQDTIDALLDAGLFGILKPRDFGGEELGISALVEVTAELAKACGSSAWVYGVLAGHSWLLNLFPPAAQQEILADPHTLIATVFRLSGEVARVDGGYELRHGAGKFCSGIDHASWVIVGNAVIDAPARLEPRFFVVPRDEIEVVDDWFSVGLRGTGSRSIRIPRAFIPEHRSVSVEALSTGKAPGAEVHPEPLYRVPFQLVAPFSIIGVPLGIARGALEVYGQGLERWIDGLSGVETAAKAASYARLAQAAAEADAARALVLEDAARIDALAEPDALSALDRARIPRDWAYAAQTTREAVSRLYAASGGTASNGDSDIQRLWRDINAASQHYAFAWDNAMSDYGRVRMGLPPLNSIPGKRR